MGERKVIQVSQAAASNGYTLVALCDDGTMWHRDSLWSAKAEWRQVPQIPLPTPAPADAAGGEALRLLDAIGADLDEIEGKQIDEFNPHLGVICTETWVMMPHVYGILRKHRAALTAARGRGDDAQA